MFFFHFSFSIFLLFTPSLLLLLYQKCALYVYSRKKTLYFGCSSGGGMFVENISFFVHGDGTARLRKMALLSSSLRVSLNKLWPKNTSGLTGYCYSRINLFFISFRFVVDPVPIYTYTRKSVSCIGNENGKFITLLETPKYVMLDLSVTERKRKLFRVIFRRIVKKPYKIILYCQKTDEILATFKFSYTIIFII